ncbi:MAG: hypothetical protein QM504_07235 [Pseudomonadota bacterium]
MKKTHDIILRTKHIAMMSLMAFSGFCMSQTYVPVLVKDINLGSANSSPQFLTPFAGKLYFGTSNLNGLWMTDGTDAGTVLADGISTIGSNTAVGLWVYNGQLFFNTISPSTWWSTTGGVDNATEIIPNFIAYGGVAYASTTLGVTKLVMGAQDLNVSATAIDLYRSDGTSGGTVAIGSFTSDSNGPNPRGFWKVGSKLLFSAKEIATGRELYSTDATTGTTQMVKDIATNGNSSSLSDVSGTGGVVLGSELYIPAFANAPAGTKLWRSNGTTAGTTAVYDDAGVANGTLTDYDTPKYLTVFNGAVYFFATAGVSPRLQLWKVTTGDTHPTQITFDADFIPPSGSFGCNGSLQPMILANTMYFPREDNSNGCELWSSDGTTAGTQMLKDINTGGADSFPKPMAVFNGELYFTALKAGFGFELWHTDGKTAGTLMVSDLNPGTAGSIQNYQMQEYNGELYFMAEDGVHGQELYKLTLSINDPIFKDGFEQIGPI